MESLNEVIEKSLDPQRVGYQRREAISALLKFEDGRVAETFEKLLLDEDHYFRREVLKIVSKGSTEVAVPILIAALEDTNEYVKQDAISCLTAFKDPRAMEPMRRLTADSSFSVSSAAKRCLEQLAKEVPAPKAVVEPAASIEPAAAPTKTESKSPSTRFDIPSTTSSDGAGGSAAVVAAPPSPPAPPVLPSDLPKTGLSVPMLSTDKPQPEPEPAVTRPASEPPPPPPPPPIPAAPAVEPAPASQSFQTRVLRSGLTETFDWNFAIRFQALFGDDLPRVQYLYQQLRTGRASLPELEKKADQAVLELSRVRDECESEIAKLSAHAQSLESEAESCQARLDELRRANEMEESKRQQTGAKMLRKALPFLRRKHEGEAADEQGSITHVSGALATLRGDLDKAEDRRTELRARVAAATEARSSAEKNLTECQSLDRRMNSAIRRAIYRKVRPLVLDAGKELENLTLLTGHPVFFRTAMLEWRRVERDFPRRRADATKARLIGKRAVPEAESALDEMGRAISRGFGIERQRRKTDAQITSEVTLVYREGDANDWRMKQQIARGEGAATVNYDVESAVWESHADLEPPSRRLAEAWGALGRKSAEAHAASSRLLAAKRLREEYVRYVRFELEQDFE